MDRTVRKQLGELKAVYGLEQPSRTPRKRKVKRQLSKPRQSNDELFTLPDDDTTSPPKSPISPPRSPTPPLTYPTSRPESPTSDNEDSIPPHIPQPLSRIRDLCIGEFTTELKMIPAWFEQEDQQAALRNIVYPSGIVDQRPFDSVARFRAAINKTNNFRKKPIESNTKSTETIIIALDKFAQQLGGDLSFTTKEISFVETAYRTACGIATLASVHLLATNHIPTARFAFHTDLNYKEDLARSPETMGNFVIDFATAIAEILQCKNEYVRVLSIEKNDDDEGNAQINFGITTPEQVFTETLANDLEVKKKRIILY